MFWIAIIGLAFSWMLIKLGFLSAMAGVLTLVVKLLLFVILAGLLAAAWSVLRNKNADGSNEN